MEPYYIINQGLYKIVASFIMTVPDDDKVLRDIMSDVRKDPTNNQIFSFLCRPVEIHWLERTNTYATIYFKIAPNQLPENFSVHMRTMYTHTFLRSTVIDPIMWNYPAEDGRVFAVDLMEDIRTRWNMQLKARRRLFNNHDSLLSGGVQRA